MNPLTRPPRVAPGPLYHGALASPFSSVEHRLYHPTVFAAIDLNEAVHLSVLSTASFVEHRPGYRMIHARFFLEPHFSYGDARCITECTTLRPHV